MKVKEGEMVDYKCYRCYKTIGASIRHYNIACQSHNLQSLQSCAKLNKLQYTTYNHYKSAQQIGFTKEAI